MRKFFAIALFFTAILSVSAQGPVWHTDMPKAVDLAQKSGKPILMFFTGSDWCGWCIRLQKEVLKTAEFNEWAKSNVILVELDFPRRSQLPPELTKQNAELQQFFGVRGYPTIWIANGQRMKDGNQISFEQLGSTGYVAGGPSKWLEGANQILARNKKP